MLTIIYQTLYHKRQFVTSETSFPSTQLRLLTGNVYWIPAMHFVTRILINWVNRNTASLARRFKWPERRDPFGQGPSVTSPCAGVWTEVINGHWGWAGPQMEPRASTALPRKPTAMAGCKTLLYRKHFMASGGFQSPLKPGAIYKTKWHKNKKRKAHKHIMCFCFLLCSLAKLVNYPSLGRLEL